jgi:hypothetical protein
MIPFSLIRPKRFCVSSGLTLLLSLLYTIGSYLRVMNAIDVGMLNPIANSFALWDYVIGVFLIVMIIWQASILIRIARAPISSLP